jgi:hypothetical protein
MQTSLSPSVCRAFLGCQIEKAVDELNLKKKIISCHPSSLRGTANSSVLSLTGKGRNYLTANRTRVWKNQAKRETIQTEGLTPERE